MGKLHYFVFTLYVILFLSLIWFVWGEKKRHSEKSASFIEHSSRITHITAIQNV